jgi:hypothetical protein
MGHRLAALVLSALVALPATAQTMMRAQQPVIALKAMPEGSEAGLPRARAHLTPKGAQWVAMESQRLRSGAIPPSQVSADTMGVTGGLAAGADIEELAFVVLMQATQDQDNDLQQIMAQTKAINNSKAAQRSQMQAQQQAAADKKDSLSDMSQMEQMKLQMAMDRRAKMIETLSNLMKKMSDTDNSIIKNMK